eukprot:1745795-Rhodomonas_salina.1
MGHGTWDMGHAAGSPSPKSSPWRSGRPCVSAEGGREGGREGGGRRRGRGRAHAVDSGALHALHRQARKQTLHLPQTHPNSIRTLGPGPRRLIPTPDSVLRFGIRPCVSDLDVSAGGRGLETLAEKRVGEAEDVGYGVCVVQRPVEKPFLDARCYALAPAPDHLTLCASSSCRTSHTYCPPKRGEILPICRARNQRGNGANTNDVPHETNQTRKKQEKKRE